MKYKLILASFLFAGALTSCNLDDDVREQSFNCTVSQLIIPDDASKPVTPQYKCQYEVKMDLNASTLNLISSTFSINGRSGSLTTDPLKYYMGYNGSVASYLIKSGEGKFSNSPVNDIKGYLSDLQYSASRQPALVLGYNTDGYTVKTFSPSAIFRGSTTTSFSMGPGAPESKYESTDPQYGLSFADDMRSATLVIYKVKFAEKMPLLEAVILKNLPVTYDRTGYTIASTEEIIPEVKEGTGTTPYEHFPFKSLTVKTTSDDLTEISCEYTVSVKMGEMSTDCNGSFTGKYTDYIRTSETEE